MKHRRELRIMPLTVELRAGEGEEAGKLVGHAAVFNQWSKISEPWFGDLYEEQMAPGRLQADAENAGHPGAVESRSQHRAGPGAGGDVGTARG